MLNARLCILMIGTLLLLAVHVRGKEDSDQPVSAPHAVQSLSWSDIEEQLQVSRI